MKLNKLYNVDARIGLNQMIKEGLQVNCVITSPPYYGLRYYEIDPSIWDGDPECEHDFEVEERKVYGEKKIRWQNQSSGNSLLKGKIDNPNAYKEWNRNKQKIIKEQICNKCGAWKGTLGLEPNFELYIKHLCEIYDLVRKVLKPTGTNWVNLGDTYSSGIKGSGGMKSNKLKIKGKENFQTFNPIRVDTLGIPQKCLLMLPQRFSIEMIKRGWILRNDIIWYKTNCMPSSASDRFTVDYEHIFFFVKSNKTQYWINENTTQLVSKQPLGTKGIEGIDWEWRECDKCFGTGIKHKKCKTCEEKGYFYDELLRPQLCFECKGIGRIRQDKECKSCKGKGIKKYNFWKGRTYYFEQQREPIQESTKIRIQYPHHKKTAKAQTGQYSYNPNYDYNPNIDLISNDKRNLSGIKQKQEYKSKYKKREYGQTLQGFIRNQSIKEERDLSRIKAKELFPNNRRKQQEYINFIHDHGKIRGYKTKPNYEKNPQYHGQEIFTYIEGRNKRCVWEIPTSPHPESHFAVFPSELIKTPIEAGCPKFICKECGKPREKIFKNGNLIEKRKPEKGIHAQYPEIQMGKYTGLRKGYKKFEQNLIGYSDCGCNAGFEPGTVLDLFVGTGTTLIEAWKSGRNFIGFEISKKYCDEIAWKKLDFCKNKRLDDFIYSYTKKEIVLRKEISKEKTLMDYIEV